MKEQKLSPEGNALFSTLLMGLASAAMIELGLIEDPSSKQKRSQPAVAKQHIDILVMLKEKTRGNLSPEEVQLVERLLTDLRLQYAKSVNAPTTP